MYYNYIPKQMRCKGMKPNKKALVAVSIVIYVFLIFLIGMAVALPGLVTWYVETMGRKQTLPTIIMVTCYPCVPFAFFTLLKVRKLISNLLKDEIFTAANADIFKRIAVYCLCISVITFVAGFFYLPFFIVFAGTGFFSLAAIIFNGIINAGITE